MSNPFIGEIRMFGGNFPPQSWAFCSGQLIAISQNDALFALIGTTYGGDGQNTFGLPDMRGRIPLHQGNSAFGTFTIGQVSGSETVTLTSNQIPVHSHVIQASSTGQTTTDPTGGIPAASTVAPYNQGPPDTNLGGAMIGQAGGNQPHDNMMPFVCVSFIICLFGIFPSRN
jgi:microcystin-dependent protein